MTHPYPAEAVERLKKELEARRSFPNEYADEVTADLAALLSYVEGMKWRPIESAPRVSKNAGNGAHGPYVLLANSEGVWVGSHCPVFTSGYRPENPWSSVMLNHRHMERYASSEPTHWLPLPPPPDSEG